MAGRQTRHTVGPSRRDGPRRQALRARQAGDAGVLLSRVAVRRERAAAAVRRAAREHGGRGRAPRRRGRRGAAPGARGRGGVGGRGGGWGVVPLRPRGGGGAVPGGGGGGGAPRPLRKRSKLRRPL